MAEIWVCGNCFAGDRYLPAQRFMDTLCDVCEADLVPCQCYVEKPTNGVWVCRVCAAKAVEWHKTHRGDPANKSATPGVCAECHFPSILFWIEPIAAEVVEVAQNCGACKYYLGYSEHEGHCSRYPPTVFFNYLTQKTEYVIPQVWASGSCGEFKAKPTPRPPIESSRVRNNPTHEAAP